MINLDVILKEVGGEYMLADKKECYLCGTTKFNKRPGGVRDNPNLNASCGLAFLSSFDYIRDDFYKKSEMHDKEIPNVKTWLNDTAQDGIRYFFNMTEDF